MAAQYAGYLKEYRELDEKRLNQELAPPAAADRTLSFDPRSAKYFERIAQELRLTPEEQQVYQRQGFVSVDHQQRYSMGSAYFAIYARDLPVLITSDSILHALHRSYDEMLKTLELQVFALTLDETLQRAHETLAKHADELKDRPLSDSAHDVDVYLTVARNLLHGGGAPSADRGQEQLRFAPPVEAVTSRQGNDAEVAELLANVASLNLQLPPEKTKINGGWRSIDYSQFRARGHYTESEQLKRYFRAMMWLGRADTAFIVTPPDPLASLEVDALREARSAALFTSLLTESGGVKSLAQIRAIIDFMVGKADNATLEGMQNVLVRSGIERYADLADDAAVRKVQAAVGALAGQQIRSQVITSPKDSPKEVPPPQIFQIFGQRFVLDSFVLSNVVFDSIVFQGKKQERMMPSGLDVMAALGNAEAARLLQPELERYHYAANLLAVRKAIDERPPSSWSSDLYVTWLDALRELDDDEVGQYPEVMRRQVWRRKQLQTQLASWSELRHDTVLYAKQSYTAVPSCGYPDGYVEPYPEFFKKLQRFAVHGADLLRDAAVDSSDAKRTQLAQRIRDGQVAFLEHFAEVMAFLASMAEKELAARPFSHEEAEFLRQTIDISGGGSGPPRYDGWYPRLLYGGEPAQWKPVIADVHTNPRDGEVLEEGVGDVNFVVVAIDNEKDRVAYVGPAYTYYEFKQSSSRLTDEEWQGLLMNGSEPARPRFTEPFRAKPVQRNLGPISGKRPRDDPRLERIDELSRQFGGADPARQKQLYEEIEKLRRELARPPASTAKDKR